MAEQQLAPGVGGLAWLEYAVVLGASRPAAIQVGLASPDPSFPLSQGPYWIGLADYHTGRWVWSGPNVGGVRVEIDAIVRSKRYTSPEGAIHIVAAYPSTGLTGVLPIKFRGISVELAGGEQRLARIRNDVNIAAALDSGRVSDGVFSFAVIGDTRSGDQVFTGLLAQIEALEPDFVIHVGDFVPHGYASEYEQYSVLVGGFDIPIVHVRGNHEIMSGPENYLIYTGFENWSFEYEGFCFVGLDNGDGMFDDEAVSLAKEQLCAAGPSFVFFHEPPPIDPWSVHSMKADELGGGFNGLKEVFQAGDVRAVFAGHIHLHDKLEYGGIPYVISGGGGSPLANQYSFGDKEYGFCLVTVNDGRADWAWIPLD